MSATTSRSAGGLFEGTAEYYGRFRGAYPAMFIDMIGAYCRLRLKDRVLDLGCGPGLLAIPMSRWAGEIVGIDPEPEMLEAASQSAKEADIRNVRFERGSSAELGPHLGHFRLATIGRAFHWMDRVATLKSLHELIVPGGAVAIVGEEHDKDPKSWRAVIRRLSDQRGDPRAPHADDPSHDQVLARSAFRGPEHLRWPAERSWNIDELLGYVRSTSMGAARARAGTTEAFEREARQALMEAEPSGRFVERYRFVARVGWRD